MSLRIDELLQNSFLPKNYLGDAFVIKEKYCEERDRFLSFLKECDGCEFSKEKQKLLKEKIDEIKPQIEESFDSIVNIFNHYEDANMKMAEAEFDDLMERLKSDLFITSIDDKCIFNISGKRIETKLHETKAESFFRVRPVDRESNNIESDANELFHLPICKRAYSNNERFSLSGFPSLYLATSLQIAWQECNYPTHYYYSEFKYIKEPCDLKIIGLYSPSEIEYWGISTKYNDFDLWLEIIIRYLKNYPLVVACSFVNQSGNTPYKQEYIVPQLLMQWIKRNKDFVQGVSYFSCIDDSIRTEKWYGYNIALPVVAPYDDHGICTNLKDSFSWTVPRFFSVKFSDLERNKTERDIIKKFVNDIYIALRMYKFPTTFLNVLLEMRNISSMVLNILQNGENIDIQLALNCFDVLSSSCNIITGTSYEKLKEIVEEKNETRLICDEDYNKACIKFEKIYNKFIRNNNDIKSENIGNIIELYKYDAWNNFYSHSEYFLLFKEDDKIETILQIFKEKHLLCHRFLMEETEKAVSFLSKLENTYGINIGEFWETENGNPDLLIINNIDRMKTPIILRQNDINVFSSDEDKFFELLLVEADDAKLMDIL